MRRNAEGNVIIGDHGLALFQDHNCRGCYYAEKEKVGTGYPCCQFGFKVNMKKGVKCLTRLDESDAAVNKV